MKRVFFAMCLMACVSMTAYAQDGDEIDNTFVFTLGDGGAVLPDGCIINVNGVETGLDGKPFISSGVYVKNTSSDWDAIGMDFTIESMPTGQYSQCFPGQCTSYDTAKKYEREPTDIEGSLSSPLQAEWFPKAYGTCTITYQLKTYDSFMMNGIPVYNLRGFGPKLTVNYVYQDPSGIDGNIADKAVETISYYDMSGRKTPVPANGLFVKKTKYADGTVNSVKVLVK